MKTIQSVLSMLSYNSACFGCPKIIPNFEFPDLPTQDGQIMHLYPNQNLFSSTSSKQDSRPGVYRW